MPRCQTRVLTWSVATVFGFIAEAGRDTMAVYECLLHFAERVRRDLRDPRPCDMIDLESFLWVQGSDECEE